MTSIDRNDVRKAARVLQEFASGELLARRAARRDDANPRQATRGASSGRRVIVTAIMGAITNVSVERDTDAEAQLMRADPDVFQLYFVTALVDLVPAGVYVVITKAVAAAMTDQPLRQTAIQLAERPLLEIARRRATR